MNCINAANPIACLRAVDPYVLVNGTVNYAYVYLYPVVSGADLGLK